MEREFPSPLLSGYVLAGGASSRMGQDKAFLTLGGQTLLQRAILNLQAICVDVAVLSGTGFFREREQALQHLARTVPDSILDEAGLRIGPAAGLCAALLDAKTAWVLIVAVDQPFLPVRLLRNWFLDVQTSGALASCMSLGQELQPVPLLLHTSLCPAILESVQMGVRRMGAVVSSALSRMGAPPLHRFHVEPSPESAWWFRNLNSSADLPVEPPM